MNMPENLYLEFDAFLRSIKQNLDGSFGVLLGAGASISSGIQSANDCIWDWKFLIYQSLSGNQKKLVDPKKSDLSKDIIQKWLDVQGKYPQLGSPEEYSFYAEASYPIDADRTKYFESLCNGKSPYVGYKLLCLLNKYGIVKSVWSTNFDGLVERAAQQANITPIAINLDCVDRIYRTESSSELLYIALHGDCKFRTLKNTEKELDSQNSEFVSALRRYFVDKNLIIIGYSGRDKSLMSALKEAFTDKGAGRLYWCGYGKDITPEIADLIQTIRSAGRQAFYIDTNGFDNVMLSLVKFCFNEDSNKQEEINEILKVISIDNTTTPFYIQDGNTKKYLKINLIPATFPDEIFQFQISYDENENRWKYLREKIKEKPLIAVPYKDKVYAISTVSTINEVFGKNLISEIERVHISIDEIEKNSHFKELFLKAALYGISQIRGLGVDYKRSMLYKKDIYANKNNVTIHEAIECGLSFVPQKKYVLFSITPTVYFISNDQIKKEIKQQYSHEYLDKMRNQQYEKKLQEWCNIMFNGKRLCFEIPVNSRSGFIFKISNNRGYAEIHHYGQGNITIYSPKGYNINQTLYHGIHINEPKLEFINPYVNKPAYDDNPMRGLSKYRPFDANYFDVFPKDVCIGSICPTSYSLKFSEFLKRLNSTVSADKLSDYVHHYTGFSNIYNCRLDIPEIHSEKWVSINDNPKSAINLAKTICTEGQKLSEQFPGIVLLIFVPNSWSNYRQFNYHGETFDLHNYIKAFAAQHRFTTQFIEEKTLYDKMVCEISWWLSLALFVKALRTPWTLADLDQNTAYAGIGYSIKKQYSGKAEVALGCSHIYNAQGQGLRYKLSKVEHPQFDKKKNPYLNFEEAYKFGMDILALFQDAMEKLPQRVVVHKRTPFKNDEIEGITNALKQAGISEIDLITITQEYDLKFIAEKIMYGQFLEDGYPVDRGTCIKLSSRNALLWTHGVVPSIQSNRRYYQGGRCIPAPLKITKYYGHGDLETIAKEILGFTKMNWNSFNLYTKLPATIDTSNTLAQVGNLLRQYNGVTYDYRFFI